jgi:predicted enzyme related to lactoylglutathione lyase
MSEATTDATKGKFVWYEYMGHDLDAAADFYAGVVGWSLADPGMAPFAYKVASAGGYPVAGLMTIPDDAKAMGAPPCWTGYVYVEDVDAALPGLTAAGGRLKKGPMDIPGVGRFAVVADPHGAMFMLFRDAGGNPPPPPDPNSPGLVGWRELHAGDGAAALAFYGDQFGWKHQSDFDMGPMGKYHLFESAPGQGGGMMTRMPQTPGPFWLYYFNVDAIDAAVERVKAKGGQIAHGPMEVPTGQWVVHGVDPQGALFALVSPQR